MDDIRSAPFGEVLQTLRKKKKIAQQVLAERLGVHRNTISAWERGERLPDTKGMVAELATQLRLDDQQTRLLLEASLTAVSPYWYVPYQRNYYFTGREALLEQLHTSFASGQALALTQSYTLSGLGGIGKTQVALEYAYRYHQHYAATFWLAAESSETLTSSFLSIAQTLRLPERHEQDQHKIIASVLQWLNSHKNWLLIFDNVEDIGVLKPFLPTTRQGSFLFSTRLHTLGHLAQALELSRLPRDEGIAFLLHRTHIRPANSPMTQAAASEVELAATIVDLVDGLPLALDQAGAYIEATQCSLEDFLHLFQTYPIQLLDERDAHAQHPHSVTTTFRLAFEQVQRNKNSAAIEILTLCAFLAPDDIPETLFLEGQRWLEPPLAAAIEHPLQFQAALRDLLAYSLIRRNSQKKTLSIHRLVQEVLKAHIGEGTQKLWAERAVRIIQQIFPASAVEFASWEQCERLLPHALAATQQMQQCFSLEGEAQRFQPVASLYTSIAEYFVEHDRNTEAEPLLQQARNIWESALSPSHVDVALALDGLANLYYHQAKFQEAEKLFLRSLQIREGMLTPDHPLIALTLHGLGRLYGRMGNHQQAEPLLLRALRILEKEPTSLASRGYLLSNLGEVYREQGKYKEAEPCYRESMHLIEQTQGIHHPSVSRSLNALAILFAEQGRYSEAEPLFSRSLHIAEEAFGADHPHVARSLTNLATLQEIQGHYIEASTSLLRALHIIEQTSGPDHPEVAIILNNLADTHRLQQHYTEAEPLYLRSLAICESRLGAEHPLTAHPISGLADIYTVQEKYAQAEKFYLRALQIREQKLTDKHPDLAGTCLGLANLYARQQRYQEAETLYRRALSIREEIFGDTHPLTEEVHSSYASLIKQQTEEAPTRQDG
ncbi:FxSxx-COOH system tetratricopeptide repeat protein [Ktedonobacter racemifer]|uniref:Transcriptional regulator, XRE family n=1 Tax=Ktedonobacter racemifer DSM 44963 TaxID=485913 RepID=D6TKB9_KTERA|nr:FxSxx-COOH system tetratricopeptide repeat protein [Ktedonobacter racemifer]EFH86219.1 transcriptional regulator, XRE family [Ktedonobacter racemifer DSM 44963]